MSHLEGLNAKQKEAVLSTEGPLLIVAGAGAGKTKTVTHRILHLIKNGVAPYQILAITFTNKAAKEMRERVMHLISSDKELNVPISFHERPFVSTFHALGVHIIRENASRVGVGRNFTILDRGDSRKFIKEAIEESGFDPKQFEPGRILNIISREKGNFVNLTHYKGHGENDFIANVVSKVWEKYDETLKKEKSLDFDDLLLKAAELLKHDSAVREHYQAIWRYVHVDEYQDTNKVQYEITRQLSEKNKNICVVGDIDQNIYSWRGASIKNILDFEKDYPGAKVVLLEENYRSTQTILTVANRIIDKNKMRVPKNLFTKNGEGEKIGLFVAYDEEEEARFIAHTVSELVRKGTSLDEIAILYRANFQSRVIEEAMLADSIPYQVLGTRFFERKEVKDILSYIRASLNPENTSDLKRAINVPARGIGKVTLLKILSGQEANLPPKVKAKVSEFRKILADIKLAIEHEKPSLVIRKVASLSGLETLLKQGSDEDKERLENIRELVTLATRYDEMPRPEATEKLLTDASLATDQDELDTPKPGVKLMTVHASKGLEFEYVFITGLEEDLFPHRKIGEESISQEEDEEERRLFYVALTRAKKRVFLSYAGVRTIFGSRQVNVPSEFIADIEDEFMEPLDFSGRGRPIKTIYFD